MEPGRHPPRQVHNRKRRTGKMSRIKDDEASVGAPHIVRECEDESVLFAPAARVRHEHRFAHRHRGRKWVDDVLSCRQVVSRYRFERTGLSRLTGPGIALPHITLAGSAPQISIVDASGRKQTDR
jgi:hypothetical protein